MEIDQKTKDRFENFIIEFEEKLESGISFLQLYAIVKKYDLDLRLPLSKPYGILLRIGLDHDKWKVTMKRNIIIHPGSSIKNAMLDVKNFEEALKYFADNKSRIVVKSFSRRDGEGKCFRYYLKKIK